MHIAVIGFGPRGLGALEALADTLHGQSATVDIFDPFAHPGAGPNFSPEDSPLCLVNIPLRDIDLGGEHRAGVSQWLGQDANPDEFLPRATLGRYLGDRFAALLEADGLEITHHRRGVSRIDEEGGKWVLRSEDDRFGPYDEVLLTLGQPATAPDDQLARWQDHASKTGADLVPAYPAANLLRAAESWAGQRVAIRGLGLSTFDVLRLLTEGMGGSFEDGQYIPSGREPACILPFSLNGHPPAPKPATGAVDDAYEPTQAETEAFADALARALAGPTETALVMLTDALFPVLLRILHDTGSPDGATEVRQWLEVERDDSGTQEARDPVSALRHVTEMAAGTTPPDAGFAAGQVWRKWQNTLRRGFNPTLTSAETARAFLRFDDGMKRYSYGPPISAARDLLTLIEAGRVDLRIADDPGIGLRKDGWQLIEDDETAHVVAMVDAVLPPPDPERITDTLLRDLMTRGRLTAPGDGLAARTEPDGQLLSQDGTPQPGLTLLGRLALGSVIASDSLHDCFGAASSRWTDGVIQRQSRNREPG
ncbi:Uncharacterized NAD(P)/FAD-binding protein YdhS [Poseidonocella pacifica]|uniref:Uncharacterized NAD(P)/FAD-binding protein YdhS n=1 Tax=Poseidonocella pacifica TaxID=871651 RepID=A0A1I0WNB3_9RHOB|nr:FAD/NAD(P)-binding domain-containing protein [Poseidonocella pacifica]SFA89483.1 Uncharacterized NAD(P)/FAD-binding protein YdhS [Poseidonocella pacifica]